MGENNASLTRSYHVGRDVFMAAAALYQELYGLEDGSVPATFQIIYYIGWKPHSSQPKPKERGSQTHSLKDIGVTRTHGNKGE
jgi:NADH dehydrogenase [ubiquinone] 1 alpha subcomplex assembly factor 5